jgi:hypothetical protein
MVIFKNHRGETAWHNAAENHSIKTIVNWLENLPPENSKP